MDKYISGLIKKASLGFLVSTILFSCNAALAEGYDSDYDFSDDDISQSNTSEKSTSKNSTSKNNWAENKKKEAVQTKELKSGIYSSQEECITKVGQSPYLSDLKKAQLHMSLCMEYPSASKKIDDKKPEAERRKGVTLKFE